MNLKKLITCAVILGTVSVAVAATSSPVTSVFSDAPSANWEHSMFSGNGEIGVMARGFPHAEVQHFSHAELYLPIAREEVPQEERQQDDRQ